MKTRKKTLFVLVAVALASVLDLGLPGLGVNDAHAIVGRPLTPMSYAGVARRTTRRAYYRGAYGAPYAAPYPVPYPVPYYSPYW